MATAALTRKKTVTHNNLSLDELELVSRAAKGDEQAFTELYNRHQEKTYRACFNLTRNKQDAEDCAQEAWIRAFAGASKFRGEAKFTTWLRRIAINSALMKLRKSADKHFRAAISINDLISDEDGSHVERTFLASDALTPSPERVSRRIKAEAMSRAIENLPHIWREAFVLCYVYEYSNQDAANTLGISLAATKTRIMRAKIHLRVALGSPD